MSEGQKWNVTLQTKITQALCTGTFLLSFLFFIYWEIKRHQEKTSLFLNQELKLKELINFQIDLEQR